MSNRAEVLLRLALDANAWIATAESCTAGLISGEITSVAGSSSVFDRGFITYTNSAKVDMLGVSQTTLDAYGAVSEQTAREMAEGALGRSNATLAVSVTGIAGPGGSEFKPEGRVCFGLTRNSSETTSTTIDFGPIGRAQVRKASVDYAIELLITELSERA